MAELVEYLSNQKKIIREKMVQMEMEYSALRFDLRELRAIYSEVDDEQTAVKEKLINATYVWSGV